MDDKKCNSRPGKGLTMLEMIISLTIIAVMFAVILPQFKNIENSWASKQATAEAIQNGRILIEYLNRNLSKAARITAVSDPCDTTGYIEFKSNDATTYRFDISANNNIEFGPVGNLSEIGGPVDQMQFTCYDAQDLDTPITDVGDVRSVHVQITMTNGGPGHDQTSTTQAYLRTNTANTGLVAHWKFDEGSGTVAADSGPNGYDATIINGVAWLTDWWDCVWRDGATQTSLYIDGWDDYVDIDSEITGEFDELTIAMWVRYPNFADDTYALFASDTLVPGSIHINIQPEGGISHMYGIEFVVWNTPVSFETYAAVLFTDHWHHIAATYSNSAEVNIYFDGILKEHATESSLPPAVIGYASIGAWDEDGSLLIRLTEARIDDVHIYSRMLDPCEISELAGTRAGVVGYWNFDEISGSTAYDSSGNNFDAGVSGANWQAGGKINGALNFDGSNDYVDTTIDSETLELVTFCTWFKSDDAGSIGNDYVAQRFFTQMCTSSGARFALGINNNRIAVYWRDSGGSNVGEGTTTLSSGQWYYAAVTYDGSVIRLYLNGNEQNSFNESGMRDSTTSTAVQIGREKSGSRYFDGLLDDVRIYHRPLTEAEIQAIYNQSEYCCSVDGGGEILP